MRFLQRLIALLSLSLCVALFSITAFAETAETVEITLPVSATGADCTALLLDDLGNEVVRLPLKDGEPSAFVFNCQSMNPQHYTVRLADTDTDKISYDKNEFDVTVQLYYQSGGIHYLISAEHGGVKPVALAFTNEVNSESAPTQTGEAATHGDFINEENPMLPPTPTPSSTLSPTLSSTFAPTSVALADSQSGKPGNTPRTGDDSSIALWGTLLVLSLCGMFLMLVLLVRERRSGTEYTK